MLYLVMHVFYSDWEIYGYFTTRAEAEKYILHKNEEDFHIEEIECLDNTIDLSSIKVRYEKAICFERQPDTNSWLCQENNDSYDYYQSKFPRSNSIEERFYGDTIVVKVNTTRNDIELQKKIAQDLLYQFLDFCSESELSYKENCIEFNKILSKEEDERKEAEKQEQIRQKELAELARLKAKYE